MTTEDMIIELEQMARQCIHAPKSKEFLQGVADRLDRLDKLKEHFLDSEAAIIQDPSCLSEAEAEEP